MEGCLEVKELITTVYYIESRPAQSAVGHWSYMCSQLSEIKQFSGQMPLTITQHLGVTGPYSISPSAPNYLPQELPSY